MPPACWPTVDGGHHFECLKIRDLHGSRFRGGRGCQCHGDDVHIEDKGVETRQGGCSEEQAQHPAACPDRLSMESVQPKPIYDQETRSVEFSF